MLLPVKKPGVGFLKGKRISWFIHRHPLIVTGHSKPATWGRFKSGQHKVGN